MDISFLKRARVPDPRSLNLEVAGLANLGPVRTGGLLGEHRSGNVLSLSYRAISHRRG